VNGDAETLAEIAAVLYAADCEITGTSGESWELDGDAHIYANEARHLLASDWLAAHDAAIRAEALEDAADGVDVMRHIGVQTDFAQWLRNRAAVLRAAQPTEGES
jgi:hypothetical protein